MHGIYHRSEWTDEREARLKELWDSGLSASQCAAQLGGVTRSAIIGKVHRLGLSGRAAPKTPRKSKAQIRRKQVRNNGGVTEALAPFFSEEPLPPPQDTDVARIAFRDLDDIAIAVPLANGTTRIVREHCRWRVPNTPPDSRDVEYCGDQKVAGLPYCEAHAERAYGAPPPRQYKNIKPGGMLIRVAGGMKFEGVS